MDFNEIITKEREILRNTTWYDTLKFFVESKEFCYPFADLCHEVNNGRHFYPSLKHTFFPFKYCDRNKLRMVLFNGYYNIQNVHKLNGFAFSEYLYEKIKDDLSKITTSKGGKKPNMIEYEEQGVLCINDCLAVMDNVEHSKKLWEPFFDYLFDMIKDENILKVSFGDTKDYGFDLRLNYITPNTLVIINRELKKRGIEKIRW